MDWVKRNLGFVIGSVSAVALLLFSGFYLYSNSKKNNDARQQLTAEYKELQRLSNLSPHPGKGKVDNIRRAKQQREEVLQFMQKVAQGFKPIPAVPPSPRVTGEEFSAELRRTIDLLNRQANLSSVILPTNYNFSFEAEKRLVKFAPGSLAPLAVQVGEVKAICGVLFSAKVNKLTGLRRVRVSPDDRTGPISDYLREPSVTNDLAVISPYEISFESFSAELADVISGFASSPHAIVIKGMNVEPAKTSPAAAGRLGTFAYTPVTRAPATPIYAPATPAYAPATTPAPYGGIYGGMEGGGRTQIRRPTFRRPEVMGAGEAEPYGGAPVQTYPPAYAATPDAYATAPGAVDASQTLIDEHPLSVTILLEVIKLLPAPEE